MNNKLRGIIYMSLSVIGFIIVSSFVKLIGPSVSGWTKAFYRSLFGLGFLLLWKLARRSGFRASNIPLLVLRGGVGGLALACSFWAIDLVDLSRATLYLYIYPIFAPLFSTILFKEKLTLRMVIPLLFACAGVVLVSGVGSLEFSFGDFIGIASGLLAGVAIATVRELRKTDTPEDIYLGFLMVSLVVCGIGIFFTPGQSWGVPLDARFAAPAVWIMLIVIGGAATFGQLWMTHSYRILSTSTGSLIGLLSMPIITAIAIIFFGEPLKISSVIGGVFIFGSAVAASFYSDTRSD